nr:BrnA antitoxin family protein [Chlorobium sp. KB01]
MPRKKNPFAAKLNKPVTIRLGEDVVDYFKSLSKEMGLPYQSLINLYLRDCVLTHRKPKFNWTE